MTCQNCQAQTTPGIYLCARCVVRLTDVLDQIPDALEVAEDTIAKVARTGGSGAASSSAAVSIEPINLDTAEKRRTLWEAVVSNARLVLEHDSSDDLREVEPVVYLQMSIDLIRPQEFAGELLGELEVATRKLWSSVDRRPDVIMLGHCGTMNEGVPCPGALRARNDEKYVRCKVCGFTENVEHLKQERAADAWEHFAPLSEVVQAVRKSGYLVNPRSARRWAEQGELPATRYRTDGVALYSPGQVVDASQRMKQRHGGRRERVA